MLVMVTLFIGTSESLPATSYAKMIDIWMVFCLISTFGQIIIHTLIEYFRSDGDNRQVSMAFKSIWNISNPLKEHYRLITMANSPSSE